MQPGQPMQPDNVRTRPITDTLELRKLWSVQEADYFYMLGQEYETQTTPDRTEDNKPDWESPDLTTEKIFGPAVNQGYAGDEKWAKKTADHFGIKFPTEEYKDEKALS